MTDEGRGQVQCLIIRTAVLNLSVSLTGSVRTLLVLDAQPSHHRAPERDGGKMQRAGD